MSPCRRCHRFRRDQNGLQSGTQDARRRTWVGDVMPSIIDRTLEHVQSVAQIVHGGARHDNFRVSQLKGFRSLA